MPVFRLTIERHERLLGHFVSDAPWASEAVHDIAARLSADDGYRIKAETAEGERRLLESSPSGIRVLSSEPIFKPMSLTPSS